MCKILALACALLFALPAEAFNSSATGNDLLEQCKMTIKLVDDELVKDEDKFVAAVEANTCLSVVRGFLGANITFGKVFPDKRLFCPPAQSTNEQSIRIVLKYLESNPEQLHLPDYALILAAFLKAYPCGTAQQMQTG